MNPAQPAHPAEIYDRYFVPAMFLPWAAILLRHAAPRAGERVLDVACGTGVVARGASPMVGAKGRVVGVDLNPAMLAVARRPPAPPGASVQWLEGNAMELPFPDGDFDLVLCQHGLPFVPDRERALREFRRVLRRGGRAAAIVLQALSRHPVFEALMESAARHLSLPLSAVATPFSLSDPEELRSSFAEAGFEEVTVVPETTPVVFPDDDRFVQLAVTSSAAAVPSFTALQEPDRAALLEAVRRETQGTVDGHRQGDVVSFEMHAHLVRGGG